MLCFPGNILCNGACAKRRTDGHLWSIRGEPFVGDVMSIESYILLLSDSYELGALRWTAVEAG